MFDNSFVNRVLYKLACVLLLPLCAAWSLATSQITPAADVAQPPAPELPSQWNGRPLRPLASTPVEVRFARQFPGAVTRMTDDGEVTLVVRSVRRATRMLHPADDCYRGLGYRIARQQLQADAQGQLWRCFEAARDGHRLHVCEHIVDGEGGVFTDASAWYWAAALGQSHGPWQALTVARPL